jgi:hypothetical protein
VRRIGIDREGFVAVTNVHEPIEIVGAHRGGPRVNLVAQIDSQFPRVLAQFRGFLHKPVLAFFDQIVIPAGPEAPRITGRRFPTERHAPKHWHDIHAQFGA